MVIFMRKIWKKLLACSLAAVLTVTGMPGAATVNHVSAGSTADVTIPDAPLPFQDHDCEKIIQEMGMGINLGNTLDGHSNYMPGEFNWNSVLTTREIIKSMHDLGFNTIRIPVTWGKMIDDEDYSIDEAWMSRVQEVVDYAISENMYVILNIHHDGAQGNVPAGGWLHVGGSKSEFRNIKKKFAGVWETIATRFKNYDEHLILESMNEVFGTSGDDVSHVKEEMDRINELNQKFVDVVRATGSNNAKRWLDVPTRVTDIPTMLDDQYGFKVPEDPAGRVMVAGHDYSGWGVNSLNEESVSCAAKYKALKEKYVDAGVPVLIGEWGVLAKHINATQGEGMSYLFKKYHLIGCLWDVEGNDGIVDRTNLKARFKTVSDSMMRGYFKDKDASDVQGAKTNVASLSAFKVNETSMEITTGTSSRIEVSDCQPEGSNDVILWKSDNALVASVYDGKIVARMPGKTTITAFSQSGTVERTIEVTVKPAALEQTSTAISSSEEELNLPAGKEAFLNASAAPADNGAVVYYSTSDETVATVSTVGRVVAKKIGTAVITMVTSDGVEKKIPVTVREAEKETAIDSHLAIYVLYNSGYSGTEHGADKVHVRGDGTYTLRFDCATDLSDSAKSAGVEDLNGIGALYIYDDDITQGVKKKSTSLDGMVSYSSVKINGKEMLSEPTQEYKAVKSSVLDTNNPINAWDGAVFTDGINIDSKKFTVTFTDIEKPTVVEVTFTLSGFGEAPEETQAPQESQMPSDNPEISQKPQESIVPTAGPQQSSIPDTKPTETAKPLNSQAPGVQASEAPAAQPSNVPADTSKKPVTTVKKKVTKITPVKKNVTLKKGKTAKVSFKVKAIGLKNKEILKRTKVTVSGKKILKINKKKMSGKNFVITVKGLKKGKSTLKVKADKVLTQMTIKVK